MDKKYLFFEQILKLKNKVVQIRYKHQIMQKGNQVVYTRIHILLAIG